MEKTNRKKKLDVGVLIGEFQTPVLLDGYREPIDKFLATKHDKHIIVLGISFMKATKNHPLDFNARRTMILEAYGDRLTERDIIYLKDANGDEFWSKQLDELITTTCKDENADMTYYGTEAEVVNRYHGTHKLVKLETTTNSNWREACKVLGRNPYDAPSWRAGVVYATEQRYPTAFCTVDCAIFDDDTCQKIWLARKPQEIHYRLVGGFADPNDNSHEDAAIREAKEETHLDCKVSQYLGSFKIDDWRYRNEQDKIITTLFAMVRTGGNPKPDDDIAELKLVEIATFPLENVMSEHRTIFTKAKEYSALQMNLLNLHEKTFGK